MEQTNDGEDVLVDRAGRTILKGAKAEAVANVAAASAIASMLYCIFVFVSTLPHAYTCFRIYRENA